MGHNKSWEMRPFSDYSLTLKYSLGLIAFQCSTDESEMHCNRELHSILSF